MAYTFLQAVNDVLKRAGAIKGDSGEFSTFTSSARQIDIDMAIKAWNDVIHYMYSKGAFSQGVAESSFTLALDDREYALASDFESFAAEAIRCEANSNYLLPYDGGYVGMWNRQIDPNDYQGQPSRYAINPTTNQLRIDTDPESDQVGDVYKYLYMKRISLSATTDTFPFSDTVVDMAAIGVAELWKRYRKKEFAPDIYEASMATAMGYLTQQGMKKTYGRTYG